MRGRAVPIAPGRICPWVRHPPRVIQILLLLLKNNKSKLKKHYNKNCSFLAPRVKQDEENNMKIKTRNKIGKNIEPQNIKASCALNFVCLYKMVLFRLVVFLSVLNGPVSHIDYLPGPNLCILPPCTNLM